jgi:hypothetical protein
MDRIHDDLRAEFHLAGHYTALELKPRRVQDSLELLIEAGRDRGLLVPELAVVF